jgi:hypothetical protein
MSQYRQDILNYGDDVNDLDCSPYEHVRMLHERTNIKNIEDKLDFNEKVMLYIIDLNLVKNADEMTNHIRKAYDFSLSDKNHIPLEQWWWHLDKIANGKLILKINMSTEKVILKEQLLLLFLGISIHNILSFFQIAHSSRFSPEKR